MAGNTTAPFDFAYGSLDGCMYDWWVASHGSSPLAGTSSNRVVTQVASDSRRPVSLGEFQEKPKVSI